MQIYSLTIEYQVYQFVQSINILEQIESILVTIVQQIPFLFLEVVVINAWSRYFVELLRRLVCQLTISFHTLLGMTFHVIGPMKRYSNFPSMVDFQLLPRKFVIQTWFCNCQQYLCLFHIVFEYIPSIHDQGKMLVLPNQLLH